MRTWPEERLRDEVLAAGGRAELTVQRVLHEFGARYATDGARRQAEEALREVGLGVSPSLVGSDRDAPVTVYLLEQAEEPKPEPEPEPDPEPEEEQEPELEEERRRRAELEREMQEAQGSLFDAQGRLSDAASRLSNVERELGEERKARLESERARGELEGRHDETMRAAAETERQLAETRRELEAERRHGGELEQQVASLSQALDATKAELEETKEALEETRATAVREAGIAASATQRVRSTRNELERERMARAKVEEDAQRVRKDFDRRSDKVTTLLAQARADVDRERAKLEATERELRDTAESQQLLRETLEAQHAELVRVKAELEQRATDGRRELDEVRGELAAEHARRGALERELEEAGAAQAVLEKELKSAKRRGSKAESDARKRAAAVSELEERLGELTAELSRWPWGQPLEPVADAPSEEATAQRPAPPEPVPSTSEAVTHPSLDAALEAKLTSAERLRSRGAAGTLARVLDPGEAVLALAVCSWSGQQALVAATGSRVILAGAGLRQPAAFEYERIERVECRRAGRFGRAELRLATEGEEAEAKLFRHADEIYRVILDRRRAHAPEGEQRESGKPA
jgi:hypothetical protein